MKAFPVFLLFFLLLFSVGLVEAGAITVDEFTSSGIQKAIDSAEEGDIIFLQEGTYNITEPIFLKSEIALRGAGQDKTVLEVNEDYLYVFNIPDEAILKLTDCDNIEISYFTIDGNDGEHKNCGWSWENAIMTYGGGSDLKIHDISIRKINGDGIRTYQHDGPCYITNVEIKSSGHDGIRVQDSKDWHIQNLDCEIYINYGVRFMDSCQDCSLKDSYFTAKEGSGNAAVGIEGEMEGLEIENCEFEDINSYVHRSGVYTERGSGDVKVSGCSFNDCPDGGILSSGGQQTFSLSGNMFSGCPFETNVNSENHNENIITVNGFTEKDIQEAIDKANSKVFLPEGKYILSDSIILKSDITFEGEDGTVITIPDHAGWEAWKPLISGIGVSNVVIRNIEFDGNDKNNQDVETKTANGKAWGNGYYNFIHVIDSDSITVENCLMHDSLGDGLRTKTSTNIIFKDNTAYRLGHDAFLWNRFSKISRLTTTE